MTLAHARPNPTPTDTVPAATGIPATSRQEAASLMEVELVRFIDLLERLGPEDLAKPTACNLWNVKDVAAHKAGALAAFASWTELWRQLSPVSQRPYRAHGMSQLDAMNQIQVDDRTDRTPAELIAELRSVGPRATSGCTGSTSRSPPARRSPRRPSMTAGWWHWSSASSPRRSRDISGKRPSCMN
jgi:hypothetical protein